MSTTPINTPKDELREEVRRRYAESALAISASNPTGCCTPACTATPAAMSTAIEATTATYGCDCGPAGEAVFGAELYEPGQRDDLPEEAVLASLGCGNPTAVAELREGETVLDLGSGGGIDVLLSARRVGPAGRAYGLDMTPEMLELANANKARAGATNVEFLEGTIERVPLPDASVDVVISNCVINLSTDKPAVFAEAYRVLRNGGRLGITDVVADDALSPEQRAERGSYVGCVAGALSFAEYRDGLLAAGFTHVELEPTHAVAEGVHSAIVRATRG